jgi:hypothetical protein
MPRYKLSLCHTPIKPYLLGFSRKLVFLHMSCLTACLKGSHQQTITATTKMILESSSTVKHTTILQNALSSFPVYFHPCLIILV